MPKWNRTKNRLLPNRKKANGTKSIKTKQSTLASVTQDPEEKKKWGLVRWEQGTRHTTVLEYISSFGRDRLRSRHLTAQAFQA